MFLFEQIVVLVTFQALHSTAVFFVHGEVVGLNLAPLLHFLLRLKHEGFDALLLCDGNLIVLFMDQIYAVALTQDQLLVLIGIASDFL